jgi:hypothetical protein
LIIGRAGVHKKHVEDPSRQVLLQRDDLRLFADIQCFYLKRFYFKPFLKLVSKIVQFCSARSRSHCPNHIPALLQILPPLQGHDRAKRQ